MEDCIPKKNKKRSQELVNPIIPLERPEKEDLELSEDIEKCVIILREVVVQEST